MRKDYCIDADVLMLFGQLCIFFAPIIHETVEHVKHRLHEEVRISWHWELSVVVGELNADIRQVVHECLDLF